MGRVAAVGLCGAVLLAGCSGGAFNGLSTTATQPGGGSAGARLTGAVHGGQQPIVGAHVYLLAAGATGYGGAGIAASSSNASVSLLTSGTGSDGLGTYVTTGSDGSFSITGDYTCAAGQQVYLYSLGGNPGAGVNSAAGLMAALGNCPVAGVFPSSTFIMMNEVSTVAAAYAMAGFATDATHVGSSGTALAATGIANAFANATNLVSLSTGTALATTPAGNGTVPQAEINTLGNILAACVNSTGAGSTQCSTLFSTTMNGATSPGDTATAAINIAHNPGANVATLFGLVTGTPTFAGGLTKVPNDFAVALNFTGGGLFDSTGLAVDGFGNVWVCNAGTFNGMLSEFSPSGAALSGSNGYTGGGLSESTGITIDGYGNVWVTDSDSLSKFNSSGTAISGPSGYFAYGLFEPRGIAVETSGNVWIANLGNRNLSLFGSSGASIMNTSGGGVNAAGEVAVDGSGNVWAVNFNSISEFNSSGAAITGASGYTGGGLSDVAGIAIDGSGNVWVSNADGNSLSKFNSSGAALSGPNGYTGGGLSSPDGIAIDGSGNVWVTNSNNSISELVGAAAPVITPIVAGLPTTPTTDGSSGLGTRP